MGENRKSYEGLDKIVLIVEDDPEQRNNLEKTVRRYFREESGTGICVAEHTTRVIQELPLYKKESPNASIYAVMDFNMGLGQAGDRKPTEMLFYHDDFIHFLKNGGVVVIYSGFPEQVRQSAEIFRAPGKYERLALLIAEKSTVGTEDVFRLLKAASVETIDRLRKAAETYQYDLGRIISAHRKR